MSAPEMENFEKFKRFLYLCTEGAVYKVLGSSCNKEKAPFVAELINERKGKDLLAEVERCHKDGNPARRETMFFIVASCAKSSDNELKQQAFKTFLTICKCPRELFMFLSHMKTLSEGTRGWGRSLRRAISQWYNQQNPNELAASSTSEISFCGWTHRDVLRLGHIKGTTDAIAIIFKYLVKGLEETKKEFDKDGITDEVRKVLEYLTAVDTVKHSTDEQQVSRLLEQHHMSLEQIPTNLLNSKEVWRTLIEELPLNKLLQNFGKLAGVGMLEESCDSSKAVIEKLNSAETIKQQNVEPLIVLLAARYYEQGKPKPKWNRNEDVVKALDSALEASVKCNIQSTNKRYLISVRVGTNKGKLAVRGIQILSNTIAAAALVMLTARKEEKVDVVYFTNKVTPLSVTSDVQLKDMCDELATQIMIAENMPAMEEKVESENLADLFRGVPPPPCDMAAPIQWATENKKAVDVFLTITDHRDKSTGETQPSDALLQYRKEMNLPNTKLITCGLTNAAMRIADPNDRGMLDIAGFDDNILKVIRKFVMNEY